MLAHLSPSQLYALLLRVRDWNTNARTAPVAQRVLHIILKSYHVSVFVNMARSHHRRFGGPVVAEKVATSTQPDGRGGVGPPIADAEAGQALGGIGGGGAAAAMKDLLRALEVYTERHLRRMEDLVDESFLVEYTLGCMDEVLGGGGDGVETTWVIELECQGDHFSVVPRAHVVL